MMKPLHWWFHAFMQEADTLSILGMANGLYAWTLHLFTERMISMSYIRAREIEQELKSRGTERGTLYVLQVLAEQMIAQQRDMRTLAQSVNQMADIIAQVVTVGENMKIAVEKLNSSMDDDDGMDRNTLTLGSG